MTSFLPYQHPTTLAEIQAMVAAKESESLHLEFKASAALANNHKDEISKDISAFANSDGGLIIYGIVENDHCADRIDEGVSGSKKEWIENKIQSNTAPRLQDVRITEILVSEDRFIYAVSVPASDRGPHQDRHTHKYYKRRNFKCDPMEDYEIRDVGNRQKSVPPLISVRIDIAQGSLLQFCVENVGEYPATDVKFDFSEKLKWEHGEPKSLSEGIRTLPSKRRLAFFYGVGHWLGANKVVEQFSVHVSYHHQGTGKRLTETFDIDLCSLIGSLQEKTELENHASTLKEALNKNTQALERIAAHLAHIKNIANPSGLAISQSALRGIAAIFNRTEISWPLLDPTECSYQMFQEVLEVDSSVAISLYRFFSQSHDGMKLMELSEMNEDLLKRLRQHFRISSSLFEDPSNL
jgi:hypothetical protein